jgi:adenylate cyclase
MTTEGFKRKLTTMFSADVVGYSRLMAEDETETLKTLKAYREILSELIKQHRGRVVDSPGDNVLAEFTSVVDGVQCAVAVQKELQARNAELPEDRRMEFRIGINLGDVIEEEDRIYGDGVNIAARLESLANPGGICISKTAFDHIETKLPLGYEYLGEQSVKNIPKLVGAYRVLMEPRVTVAEEIEKEKAVPLWRRKSIFVGAIAVLVAIIAVAIWNFYLRPPPIEPASVGKMAFPLPDKPSIAVLPFDNLTGDPRQEYFSDGMTEEIITALSKVPYLFVIARNSTFSYKGQPVKIHQVAEELGVRYVLEGSVRKSGDKVRITAQLIDAVKGHHLWAEKYDRDLKDIFALQDEITLKILTALRMKLARGDAERLYAKGTKNLEAYLKCLQARELISGGVSKEKSVLARRLAQEAVHLDPNYSEAYRELAATYVLDVYLGMSKSPRESLKRAVELSQKAIALDNSNAHAHSLLAVIYLLLRQHDKAVAAVERAHELEPNSPQALYRYGHVLWAVGRWEEALPFYEEAMRLNPIPPNILLRRYGALLRELERYDEAIAVLKKAIEQEPKRNLFAYLMLAVTYCLAGREEEARETAKEVLRINPKFSVKYMEKTIEFKNPAHTARLTTAMRKAGLPD